MLDPIDCKFMSYFSKTYSGFSIASVFFFFPFSDEETRDMRLQRTTIGIPYVSSLSLVTKVLVPCRFLFYLIDSYLFINAESQNALSSNIV